jgi:ABC-type amino acid transport substrate-binding protein
VKIFRKWALLLVLLALVVSACSGDDDDASDDTSDDTAAAGAEGEDESTQAVGANLLDEIKERGTLRVGMTLQFEPQMYRDENDEPAGYDVELVNLLAEDLGVELEISDLEFDALIPGMLAGQFDLVSVGLVGRPERLEQLWFSCPYVPYRQVVVVNDESGIGGVEDLNSSDVTMTALIGSTAANLIQTQFPDAELVELEQGPAFLEVASGRADAIVVEEYLALPFVEENPGTSVLNPDNPFSQEYGAWALPRGDSIWLNYINGWLGYYISNGTLDGIYSDIIGPTEGLPACN